MNKPLTISDAAKRVASDEIGNSLKTAIKASSKAIRYETFDIGHFVQLAINQEVEQATRGLKQDLLIAQKQFGLCEVCQCNAYLNDSADGTEHCEVCKLREELAEAQQWIDSEPDWKDKYNANYLLLTQQLTQLRKVAERLASQFYISKTGNNEAHAAFTAYTQLLASETKSVYWCNGCSTERVLEVGILCDKCQASENKCPRCGKITDQPFHTCVTSETKEEGNQPK